MEAVGSVSEAAVSQVRVGRLDGPHHGKGAAAGRRRRADVYRRVRTGRSITRLPRPSVLDSLTVGMERAGGRGSKKGDEMEAHELKPLHRRRSWWQWNKRAEKAALRKTGWKTKREPVSFGRPSNDFLDLFGVRLYGRHRR